MKKPTLEEVREMRAYCERSFDRIPGFVREALEQFFVYIEALEAENAALYKYINLPADVPLTSETLKTTYIRAQRLEIDALKEDKARSISIGKSTFRKYEDEKQTAIDVAKEGEG